MTNIRDFMAQDHRWCDGVFEHAEHRASAKDWDGAAAAFSRFKTMVLRHFDAEESVLFPAFEEEAGMRMGPTQVMRGEHVQMRQLIEAASAALAEKDGDDYAGFAETLLIMMQQHNLKEENVLYPLCDQHLGTPASTVLPQLQKLLPAKRD
jgi:iron-sulfur cluster repair protein YtfE (RIC family)